LVARLNEGMERGGPEGIAICVDDLAEQVGHPCLPAPEGS